MNIRVEKADLAAVKADMVVVNLFEGVKSPGGATGAVDKALGGLLSKEISETGFSGKEGATLLFPTHGKIPAKRVLLLGLGPAKGFSLERVRRAAAVATKKARELKQKRTVTVLHGAGIGGLSAREAARALAEGALLALYQYDKYHDEKRKKRNDNAELVIVESDPAKAKQAEQGMAEGVIAAKATAYARDLVNEPASVATPAHLAEHARRIAKETKGVTVKVFDREQCRKLGMNAFLAVAQGATEDPYFIHLTYRPAGGAKKKIAIVGKGVTFDSGGLQTKTGSGMSGMKCDMSGAAAVLGLFSAIADVAPKAEVHGIIAATENMPGKSAYKPGDVVRAMNGTTIEIGHTDAEGRVTLADSLSYAAARKPDIIVDLATLTGACVNALGEEIAGLMTDDAKLRGRLEAAAED